MRLPVFVLIFCFPLLGAGQTSGFIIEDHINAIISAGDEVQNQQYYDLLLFYYDNPIDLNKTSRQELALTLLFTSAQVEEMIQHRIATGNFQSVYELQALTSFQVEDIKRVLPFITVTANESLNKVFSGLFAKKDNYVAFGYSRVAELARGYREHIYVGSPDQVQLRLRLRNPGKLSIGLAAQKDPGEQWLYGTRIKQPDYLSGHLYLENQGRLKQLTLGDFRLQFGQGLVLGAGFLVGKNIETVSSVKQTTLGLLPYNSITENSFFRGAGVTVGLVDNLNLTMFYSNQWLDATRADGTLFPAVSALRTSGFHRTIAEINAQDVLNEQVWGGALGYTNRRFSTGVVFVGTQFDKDLIPQDRPYNQFAFRGRELLNYSWYGQYALQNFILFGEVAQTQDAGGGITMGLIGNISRHLDVSILFRSFEKDFHSLYGQSFSERSTLSNEHGVYYGLKIYPTKTLTISSYFDMYTFPWLTASTAALARGKDFLFRIDNRFSKQIKAFFQFRNESSMNREIIQATAINSTNRMLKAIANLDYGFSSKLSFRTRVQYNSVLDDSSSKSWLMLQDINYSTMKFGLSGRILFFDADSFATRQYVYEKDMLFAYLTRGYNGRGVSYYLIGKYKPWQNLSIRAKWAYTEYLNQSTIGSGYDLISSASKTQFTAQIYFQF